ncbi:MAG TPA: aminotransferase class V-fold PLP-dependent enzyme [Aldersonia sp.]
MDDLLHATAEHAVAYLNGLPDAPVGATATDPDVLRARLGGGLPEVGASPASVIEDLVSAATPGIAASAGPRFFGFVTGGALPAALAADWLTSTWDQNAVLFASSPAAAIAEEVVGGWLADLLGLPSSASFTFTTGCQMAHVTCLAAARHAVLADAGWDVERQGLGGAPRVRVLTGAARHVTVDRALRLLGLGTDALVPVAVDGAGRMDPAALSRELRDGPTIVVAQAGEVNTGSFDPFGEIVDAARAAGAWVHVDGAFGLWAAASPAYRHLTAGAERADSWASDAHKWLNVPYDSGLAFCARPSDHRAAISLPAAYLTTGARDGMDWSPEASRRARAFAAWAALRSLGRSGVAELVDRCCSHARRFAALLGDVPGLELLNDVVLNQVLVRFGDDTVTDAVIAAVQADGTCWLGGTVWQGRRAMRISVSNWSTTDEDVVRSAAAIRAAAAGVA